MSDYNDGKWHGWNGGNCPVHPKSKVQVATNIGVFTDLAGKFEWDNSVSPIVAFKVVEKFEEPKVIWVNEYENAFVAHTTEERAKKYSDSGITLRVAVKYVESRDD